MLQIIIFFGSDINLTTTLALQENLFITNGVDSEENIILNSIVVDAKIVVSFISVSKFLQC